jgi:NAD(P)-dependent dehydrogenase (short-subunit alcohol dehydrogenase family)
MSRKVIITGAAGNLGSATVDKFLREGYHVIATVEPGTRHHFVQGNSNLEVHQIDVTDENAAREFVQHSFEEHKNIAAAVLLVGGFSMGGIAETSLSDLHRMFKLNFESCYNLARPAFLRMQWQENGGRLVLVGARPALDPAAGKGVVAYSLSKSLVFSLADLLNAAGEGKNVITSVIVPSIIDTPANRASMPKADFSAWVRPEALADRIELASRPDVVPGERVVKVYGGA